VQNSGSLTTSGSNTTTISGTLNIGTSTSSSAQATLNAPFSASGATTVYGTMKLGNAFSSSSIANNGTLQVNSGVAATISGAVTNSGAVNMAGSSSISASSYSSTDSHTTNITGTGSSSVGAVTTTGAINLASTLLIVNSTVTSGGPWTIFTAGSGQLTPPSPSNVILPSSTSAFFAKWSYDASDSTHLIIDLVSRTISSLAIGQINYEIAQVLDNMNSLPHKNSGQQQLLNDVFSSTNQSQLNQFLHELMPANNSTAATIAIQNQLFDTINMRSSYVREDRKFQLAGISSGELNPNSSFWLGPLGDYANQQESGISEGYKAYTYGLMLGADHRTDAGGVIGLAAAYTNTNVEEKSNDFFKTHILGWHGILYGNLTLPREAFIEWIATGVTNKFDGNRSINAGIANLNVTSDYKGWQAGARVNFGKTFDLTDYFNLTQFTLCEYIYVHQPPYNETGSVAALHVAPPLSRNIVTVGEGFRFGFYGDDPFVPSEVHIVATYDIINDPNTVVSNFVVGSDIFSIYDNPQRFALRAGFDYGVLFFDKLALEFSYDFVYRVGYTDNSGTLRLKYIF
jgi:uncharacterized protein with beta-barrel porin domain